MPTRGAIIFHSPLTSTLLPLPSYRHVGPEWGSSDEDEEGPAVHSSGKTDNKKKGNDGGAASKKSEQATQKSRGVKGAKDSSGSTNDCEDTVLYIGHLPKEFEERDLIQFLSQFGKVVNCRVARKIETGNPKGFAFARYADGEVAKIACETLHGYLVGRQRLVCHLRPAHQGMFFDTDTAIVKHRQMLEVAKRQRGRNLANTEKLKVITARLVEREQRKREKLEAMGIVYDFPGYKASQTEYEVPLEDADQKNGIMEKDGIEVAATPKQGRKRNNSVDSQGSANKKKKTKDLVTSEASAKKVSSREESIGSVDSAKKSKRKDSIDSVGSNSSEKKHSKKRKDSIDAEGTATKKTKNSDVKVVNLTSTPTHKSKSNSKGTREIDASHHEGGERMTKSAKKDKNKKKKGNRRVSAP